MDALLGLLGVGALVWFVSDSLAARERLLARARAACDEAGVQFLDDSVSVARMRLGWGPAGLRLLRHYRFEFSTRGDDRCRGSATMLGRDVEFLRLELPQGAVIVGTGTDAVTRIH
ncbi:MAG: DUF3301 domain-containing protein [Gammaproteobacteria bacterium]|nr:DUF3301 domain-containing protein [Gammaproteobacteria bacterium]